MATPPSTDQWIHNGCRSVMVFKYCDGSGAWSDHIKISLLPHPDPKVIFHHGDFESTPHGSWHLDLDGTLSLKYKDKEQTEILQTFLRLDATNMFKCKDSSRVGFPSMVTLLPWTADAQPGTQSTTQSQAMAHVSGFEFTDHLLSAPSSDPNAHHVNGLCFGYRDCEVVDPGPPQPDDPEVTQAFLARFAAAFPEGSFASESPAASDFCLRAFMDNDVEMDTACKLRVLDLIAKSKTQADQGLGLE